MPSGGGPVRVRCVGAGGRDIVLGGGGCGFDLGAGSRVAGGGSGLKNDMSIPLSLSSSSNSMYIEVSGREIKPDIGFSHSASVSERSMTSCIAVSPSFDAGSGKVALRAMAGLTVEMLEVPEGSPEVGASLRSQFRFGLGNEVGVDFPDTRRTGGTLKLSVFANARPRGSCLRTDMDMFSFFSGAFVNMIADTLEVLVRGRALRV